MAAGSSSPVVRTATLDDASSLATYATELFAERLPGIYRREAPTIEQEIEFITSRIAPSNSTLLIAEEDGNIVGLLDFLGGSMAEEAHAGSFGLSVARDHRGRGIGSMLVGSLIEWAPTVGVSRIEVRAWSTNPRALALYERLGFEREGLLHDAIAVDGRMADVIVLARLVRSHT